MDEGAGLVNGRERFFELDDGVRGTLEAWGKAGPALVCVHGMTSSRKGWTRLAGRLSGERRVFAYDQRGHGDLADVTGPMTLEQSVRDLEAAVRATGVPVDLLLGRGGGSPGRPPDRRARRRRPRSGDPGAPRHLCRRLCRGSPGSHGARQGRENPPDPADVCQRRSSGPGGEGAAVTR